VAYTAAASASPYGLCISCGAAVSHEAYVASSRLPRGHLERVYGQAGQLCAECFLAGYRMVVA
jgi:hypothetical protein